MPTDTQQLDIRNPGYRGCDSRYSYSGMDIPPQTHHQAQEAARRPPGPHLLPRGADPPQR
jgi:hypothetical protein